MLTIDQEGMPGKGNVSPSIRNSEKACGERTLPMTRWAPPSAASAERLTPANASQVAGSLVTFTFTGPSVAWVGPTGPTRGKAYVYLDGTLLTTVDTYSSSFSARRVLQTIYTSNATHRVAIRVLGTSGRPWIAVDAFFVMQQSG